MARVLKSFDFGASGRRGGHDWQKWMNGKIWQLTRGRDYTSTSKSLQTLAAAKAKEVGADLNSMIRVRPKLKKSREVLILQFVAPSGAKPTRRRRRRRQVAEAVG